MAEVIPSAPGDLKHPCGTHVTIRRVYHPPADWPGSEQTSSDRTQYRPENKIVSVCISPPWFWYAYGLLAAPPTFSAWLIEVGAGDIPRRPSTGSQDWPEVSSCGFPSAQVPPCDLFQKGYILGKVLEQFQSKSSAEWFSFHHFLRASLHPGKHSPRRDASHIFQAF